MDINEFSEKFNELKESEIDHTQCTEDLSFLQNFHKVNNYCNKKSQQNQQEQFKEEIDEIKKFNLANGKSSSDVLGAADYLLERELGDTFLFKDSTTKPIFIPITFVSKLYKKDASYIEYHYMNFFRDTRNNCNKNSPDCWFTKELDAFLTFSQTFSPAQFDEWIMKIKILYLIKAKVPQPSSSNDSHRINSCDGIKQFIESCSDYLNNCDEKHRYSVNFLKNELIDGSLDGARKWVKEHQKELQSPLSPFILEWFFNFNLTDISGEEPEKSLFDKLKKAFHSEDIKDTKFVVLHASQIMVKKGKEQEFDFLLFSADRKLVIGIEVKRSLQKQKPFDQLKTYKSILEERLGDQFEEGWTYLPVICIHVPTPDMLKVVSESHESKIHFIHSMTNVVEWINSICLKFPVEKNSPQSEEQLKNVLKILVFVLQMSTQTLKHNPSAPCGQIVQSKWVDFVDAAIKTISTTNNIIFYSKNQLPIFHSDNPRYKKLLLRGCYGTGKTFLLRKKAEWLAENEGNVIYYIHKCTNKKTLLQIFLEKKWESKSGIRVVNEKDLEGNKMEWKQDLIDYSKKEKAHVFIDEMDRIECIADMFDKLDDKFVWIASVYNDKLIKEANWEIYQTEKLLCTMRNSEGVVKFAGESGKMGCVIMPLERPPSNLPHGLSPEIVNSEEEAVRALRVEKGILVIICQSLQMKANKVEEIYTKMEEIYTEKNIEIACYFDTQELHDLDIKKVESKECLKQLEDGVLMIDYKIASGFEHRCILLVSDEPEKFDKNMILRCTVKLVVLQKKINIS